MINRIMILILVICVHINSKAQVTRITTCAGNGIAGYCCDGGPATSAEINNANQICIDRLGNLFFTDDYNHRVRKINLSTGIITTVAGTGIAGYNGDNIPATDAELYIPDAIYADTIGNVYIGDPGNYRVRKIIVATGIITTIAGNGISGNAGDGGQATNAYIYGPDGLYIDARGNIYIADVINNNVRKVSPSGIITTVAGNGAMGYTGDGGPATNATFNYPAKAIVDNFGNIIISDGDNNVLRKVDVETGIITTIVGNGTAGYTGDGGPAIYAKLSGPDGIYIDKQNNIYFAEYGNGTIRKIDGTTGIISTVVGCGIQGYYGDGGPATNAELIPEDITFDSYGTMYIADYENNRIRKVYDPNSKTEAENIKVSERGIVLYPNPAQEELTISYDLPNNEGASLQITDLAGRIVAVKELSSLKQQEIVDIGFVTQGFYLFKVVTAGGVIATGKIVKE